MKTFLKPFGVLCAAMALGALMAAGITGEFTQVTSVNGYQVAGAAGSSGQGLCSNGTFYNTPCNVGPGTLYYQTVMSGGTAVAQEPKVNFIGATCVDNSGATQTDCTIATPSFTGTSGYQVLSSGLIFEWGETPDFDTGPQTVTFPLPFPHACLMPPQLTDNNDVSTIARIWLSGSCTTTSFVTRNDGSGQAHYLAIGY